MFSPRDIHRTAAMLGGAFVCSLFLTSVASAAGPVLIADFGTVVQGAQAEARAPLPSTSARDYCPALIWSPPQYAGLIVGGSTGYASFTLNFDQQGAFSQDVTVTGTCYSNPPDPNSAYSVDSTYRLQANVVPSSTTVSGIVTDPSGLPVAGATVSLNPLPLPGVSAVTGADGSYRVGDTGQGASDLYVTPPPTLSTAHYPAPLPQVVYPVSLVRDTNVVANLKIDEATVAGTVTAADARSGTSVPLDTVTVTIDDGTALPLTGNSWSTYLLPGRHTVSASGSATGYNVQGASDFFLVEPSVGINRAVVLQATSVTPVLDFVGTVRDLNGAPVPGVIVSSNEFNPVTTDATGSYSVTIDRTTGFPPRGFAATFTPPTATGLAKVYFRTSLTSPAPTTVNVALPVAGGVSGVFTGPNGQPVSGATVILGSPNANQPDIVLNNQSTVTGADGSYTFAQAVPGTSLVEAILPSLPSGPFFSTEVTIASGTTTTANLRAVFGTLAGRVTAPDGSPIVDGTVTATLAGETVSANTGPDGRYTLALRPGSWQIIISQTTYELFSTTAAITESATTALDATLSSGPPAVVPESPWAVLLPVSFALLILVARRRASPTTR
jgi:hypothetical protein